MGKFWRCWATGLFWDYASLSFLTRKLVPTEGEGLSGWGFTPSSLPWAGPPRTLFGPHGNACCLTRLLSLCDSPFSYLERKVLCKEIKCQVLVVCGSEALLGSTQKAPFLRALLVDLKGFPTNCWCRDLIFRAQLSGLQTPSCELISFFPFLFLSFFGGLSQPKSISPAI